MPPKKSTPSSGAAAPKVKRMGAAKPPAKKPAGKPAAKPAEKAEDKKVEEATAAMAEMKMIPSIDIGLKGIIPISENQNPAVNETGRWPLVIDNNGNVSTFLRHRDCNYLDALDQAKMDPEKIRLALLGGIRYGKPVIIDLMGSDIWEGVVVPAFEKVKPGLLKDIYHKNIIKEECYKELVKDSDEEDYTKLFTYGDHIIAKFVFIVLTTNDNVPQSLKNQMVVVNVS